MEKKYTVADLEENGVEASGTFYGTPRKGWIMNMVDFVDYAGYAQLVIPVADAMDLKTEVWSDQVHCVDRLHAVIQFKKSIQFPRFSMSKGERWGMVIHPKSVHVINAIEAGERFKFAGGQCLAEDVELIYLGPADLGYSRACGYIPQILPDALQPV